MSVKGANEIGRLASPLQAGRDYDMPASRHAGRSAALRVPCSEGPASRVFDRGLVPDTELIAQEPRVFPHRLMETPRALVAVSGAKAAPASQAAVQPSRTSAVQAPRSKANRLVASGA